ncbi:hypothetical protein RRG08_065312, partial [Elysia crispata]
SQQFGVADVSVLTPAASQHPATGSGHRDKYNSQGYLRHHNNRKPAVWCGP